MRRKSAPPTWRTSPACSNWPATRPRRPRPPPIPSWPWKPSWRRPLARSWNCATPRRTTTSSNGPRWPKLAPGLDWDGYFATIAFPRSETNLLVRQPEFFTAFGGLLTSEPLAVWRNYLRWHLLSETANYLSKPFVEEHFSFYGKKLSGATELRPRWKRVLAAEDVAIGEDLGQLYVQKAFSPAAKARAQTMVNFHKEAMRGRIRAATWMSQATKAQAYKKLDTMRSKVGYPDKWRDYGKLDIARRPYVLNVLAANAFEFQRELAKLGKPVDRNEWNMTPQTNNAYYEPTLNEMCFPAGILQPPFFDEKADDATNYGAIGATIGHELTHGFDDQGRQYDSEGNLKNWWTDDDAKGFQARAERVARQYDAFEVLPGLHINGQQTLGENIADIGGLRVCLRGLQAGDQGQEAGARRRFHAGPAILHRLCPELADQRAPRGGASARGQRRA